jgi:uncharacterized protein (TIGR04255 family)
MIPVTSGTSWILDIDVFSPLEEEETISVRNVEETATSLAARAYTFFRWATTPAFLKIYGG